MVNRDIFSKRLKEVILLSGLSKVQIAAEVGVTKQSLNSWLVKRALPSADKLYDLAELLDTSIDYLLGRSDER